jgi:hypothetical protein
MQRFLVSFLLFFVFAGVYAQPVPAGDENIPYLMTFGPRAEKSWGDDDFSQTFFFLIPEKYQGLVYIRVYDPDCGGEIDEINNFFDTQTSFTVYGGKGSYTNPDAQGVDPTGNYKSGNMLATKTFGVNPKYDKGWYTFGPFNPTEGENYPKFKGNIFKVIAEGTSGDDGNMYRYFLSSSADENKAIEGANAFAYEYTFRMWDDPNQVSHIYPYVDDRTISVKVSDFDWDNDGFIRVVSVARKEQMIKVSNQSDWTETEFKILPEEKNTSLDIQFIKRKSPVVRNNNVVVTVRNQYGEFMPFYTSPIGGVPKYKYGIKAEPKKSK